MCTAISSNKGKYHLFGRTLDLECSYGETVVITPRNFKLNFINEKSVTSHLAITGIACIRDNTPLYYDAINEAGLAIAGLNFPGNAVYHRPEKDMYNIASFELIPWMLCQCKTLSSAVELLKKTNIIFESFSPELPATPLHWIIADKDSAVTVESVDSGLEIYENPFGVLTNNPPFQYHTTHISNFMQLDSKPPQNKLCSSVDLTHYSRGMGALGLPGDFSSSSRFVRAVFAENHTSRENNEKQEISRFFHIMDSIAQPCGCVKTDEGKDVLTIYTSCANTDTLIYYFTTYNCRRIKAIDTRNTDLDSDKLVSYPMVDEEDILTLN